MKKGSISTVTFTIHFATINTRWLGTHFHSANRFTIHFATINTLSRTQGSKPVFNLQYTLLLLILSVPLLFYFCRTNLQYTLLLLIPNRDIAVYLISEFTIHFATINTIDYAYIFLVEIVFTIHFATINTKSFILLLYAHWEFTIHFATINTALEKIKESDFLHLHYTLLLLIPFQLLW